MREICGKDTEGRDIYLFTLQNRQGMMVKITNYGGIITGLSVPDRRGTFEDIVLGFDTVEEYFQRHPYFGATVGRYANRIGGAVFSLNGKTHRLAVNNNDVNHLHGGIRGFDKVLWEAEPLTDNGLQGLRLSYLSRDGEEGYPGNLQVTLNLLLNEDNSLVLDYHALTDAATPVNLTNHSYFNLGAGREDILGHEVMIRASTFTEVDDMLIPTGRLIPVRGTPLDFTSPKSVGRDIKEIPGGYDHNFVLDRTGEDLPLAATVHDRVSGRFMEVFTTKPGVQFYTGNFLDGTIRGKKGVPCGKHMGLCLETQYFPDSPNRREFPSCILEPTGEYLHRTTYRFSVR